MTEHSPQKTVLVVEDEAEVSNFATRVLELEGYRVLRARDGEAGLKMARRHKVSLMLLDLRLPGRDGWSVLEEMKTSGLAQVPVVVFTASAAMPLHDKALSMGAQDYLVKPLSAARLREAVARAARGKG